MPAELHDLSVAIGELKAEMRIVAKTQRDNQEVSTAEHRKVHDIVSAMAESVRMIAKDVAEMKPLTDDYREKRAEARGAARFLKAGYALAGGSLAVGIGKMLEWISARPHP